MADVARTLRQVEHAQQSALAEAARFATELRPPTIPKFDNLRTPLGEVARLKAPNARGLDETSPEVSDDEEAKEMQQAQSKDAPKKRKSRSKKQPESDKTD